MKLRLLTNCYCWLETPRLPCGRGSVPNLASNQIFKDLDTAAGDLFKENRPSTGLERRFDTRQRTDLNARFRTSRKLGKPKELLAQYSASAAARFVHLLGGYRDFSGNHGGLRNCVLVPQPRSRQPLLPLTRTSSTLTNLGPFRKGRVNFFHRPDLGAPLIGAVRSDDALRKEYQKPGLRARGEMPAPARERVST